MDRGDVQSEVLFGPWLSARRRIHVRRTNVAIVSCLLDQLVRLKVGTRHVRGEANEDSGCAWVCNYRARQASSQKTAGPNTEFEKATSAVQGPRFIEASNLARTRNRAPCPKMSLAQERQEPYEWAGANKTPS